MATIGAQRRGIFVCAKVSQRMVANGRFAIRSTTRDAIRLASWQSG